MDNECIVCGADNLGDYPACGDCALTTHFTHRQDCIHCFMKDTPVAPMTDADLDAMERESFLGRALDLPRNEPAFGWCGDERCQGGTIIGSERACSDGTIDTADYPCPVCAVEDNRDLPF